MRKTKIICTIGPASEQEDKLRELFYMSISVNNSSSYDRVNNKIIGGNITDKALLNYIKEYKCDYTIIKREEFNSKNKYMYTKIKYNDKDYYVKKEDFRKKLKKCRDEHDDLQCKILQELEKYRELYCQSKSNPQ